MVLSERPTAAERRELESALERDFQILVDLLGRNLGGDAAPEMETIKQSAQRGLTLARQIVRGLGINDNEPLGSEVR